jgi:hypothetical protein
MLQFVSARTAFSTFAGLPQCCRFSGRSESLSGTARRLLAARLPCLGATSDAVAFGVALWVLAIWPIPFKSRGVAMTRFAFAVATIRRHLQRALHVTVTFMRGTTARSSSKVSHEAGRVTPAFAQRVDPRRAS